MCPSLMGKARCSEDKLAFAGRDSVGWRPVVLLLRYTAAVLVEYRIACVCLNLSLCHCDVLPFLCFGLVLASTCGRLGF